MASIASNNKRIGAKFEADVRNVLNDNGYFNFIKGVSCKGIDIFAINEKNAIQLELKTHIRYNNSEYKSAIQQLKDNYFIVKNFKQKTNYKNIDYYLIYYIRNEKLLIVDVNENKVEFIKTRLENLNDFLLRCLKEKNIIK